MAIVAIFQMVTTMVMTFAMKILVTVQIIKRYLGKGHGFFSRNRSNCLDNSRDFSNSFHMVMKMAITLSQPFK